MKLVAGLGNLDDYIAYVKAGADEVFIGYQPENWQLRYGPNRPLNRREVCYYNVQIGSQSELEILKGLEEHYQVPVSIALNALSYAPEQLSVIAQLMGDCQSLGFSSFIIADVGLLFSLEQSGLPKNIQIQVSGEFGEMNHLMQEELKRLGMKRLIFHRKLTLAEMQCMIARHPEDLEYEAFFLNEMCHFHGAFCNSLHCDDLVPMCRMPDSLSKEQEEEAEGDLQILGGSGCAFCALWKMKRMGISHLKIVGRGAFSQNMIRDLSTARKALELLEDAKDEGEYLQELKRELFPDGCSGRCYYR